MATYIELLQSLRTEFEDKIHLMDGSVHREVAFAETANKIKVAIGMRRCGKTFLCLQKIKELLSLGVPFSQILYLNFEDDRLMPLTQEKLVGFLEAFYTLHPENHDRLCYLFLDEIQNVENWPIVIRRFFDTRRVNLFLTGSSSKLLSKEIATSLRGRSIATEVWPFSFKEYLFARKIAVPEHLSAKKSLDRMRAHLIEYLIQGGFPGILQSPTNEQLQILQELVDVVVFRDIVERYRITNITLIKYLIKTLINNISSPFSVNKFCKDLKIQGMHVSKNTIHDYLVYIEDAFLIFNVPIYSHSLRKTQTSPKKTYIVDPGLYHAYAIHAHTRAGDQPQNLGRIFENFIYLVLRRSRHDVYYYTTRSGFEVDFLAKSIDGKMKLYQVVWETEDPTTLAREKRALSEAQSELGIEGRLITFENFLSHLHDLDFGQKL